MDLTQRRRKDDIHLQAILDLARRLGSANHDRQDTSTKLCDELQVAITSHFPLVREGSAKAQATQLENVGCSAWNSSITLTRSIDPHNQDAGSIRTRYACLLRAFAFFLLDINPSTNYQAPSIEQRTRTFMIGLQATQYVLTRKNADLALKLLERSSVYAQPLTTANDLPLFENEQDDTPGESWQLNTTYLLLRIQHAQLIGHWDMAEHFFNKLDRTRVPYPPIMTELAAQLFHSCGEDLQQAGQHTSSAIWFDRVLDLLNTSKDSHLTQDIRLSTTTRLTSRLLQLATPEAIEQAWKLADELDNLHRLGNHPITLAIRADILLASKPVRKDVLIQLVQRLMGCDLDDQVFASIMRLVHKIKTFDLPGAQYMLDRLLTHNILASLETVQPQAEHIRWLESGLVTLAYLVTSNATSADSVARLNTVLDVINEKLSQPLSANAVHATQTLLWKAVNTSEVSIALRWLSALQHTVLTHSEGSNQACIGRKVIHIQLQAGNAAEARAKYFQLPQHIQDEPLSRYLAFKIALAQSDSDWAMEHLQKLARNDSGPTSLLYACALEAQTSSHRSLTLAALTSIVENTSGLVAPSLLRCIVFLQTSELESANSLEPAGADTIAAAFERCVAAIEQKKWTAEQMEAELPWWCRASYNFALQWSEAADTLTVVRLLESCIRLSKQAILRSNTSDTAEYVERQLLAHFLAATALIVKARDPEEKSEASIECYSRVTTHVLAFQEIWRKRSGPVEPISVDRAFELHRFHLEAICRLRKWTELNAALDHSLNFTSKQHWDRLADIVLIIHKELSRLSSIEQAAHIPNILDVLQHIVNTTWRQDKDVKQAARWVRLTFAIDTAAIDKSQSDGRVAHKLLNQAAEIAKRGRSSTDGARYPSEELQWLASVSFNRGVDCCVANQREMAWKWFDAALDVARHMDDKNALHDCLMARRKEAEDWLAKQRH